MVFYPHVVFWAVSTPLLVPDSKSHWSSLFGVWNEPHQQRKYKLTCSIILAESYSLDLICRVHLGDETNAQLSFTCGVGDWRLHPATYYIAHWRFLGGHHWSTSLFELALYAADTLICVEGHLASASMALVTTLLMLHFAWLHPLAAGPLLLSYSGCFIGHYAPPNPFVAVLLLPGVITSLESHFTMQAAVWGAADICLGEWGANFL